MIKLWLHRLITKRVDFGLFSYSEAEEMLAKGWEIAKEEDENYSLAKVYLEKRVLRRQW